MTYKTIFTALSEPEQADWILAQAADFAAALDAHLEVLTVGVDRSQTGYYYAGANAMILHEAISRATEEAETLEAAVEKALKGAPLLWGQTSVVAALADLTRPVAMRARYSDIAVMPTPYGEAAPAEQEILTEALLFQARLPVLVLPKKTVAPVKPGTVILAWNDSIEAMTAFRAALPLLKAAKRVCVTVIDPPVHGPDRSDPGGAVSQYLSRHGVKVEVDVLSRSLPRVSDVLMRQTADENADLLVMGAYGHSRFREAILGGATRDMLEGATVPVLMAH